MWLLKVSYLFINQTPSDKVKRRVRNAEVESSILVGSTKYITSGYKGKQPITAGDNLLVKDTDIHKDEIHWINPAVQIYYES